MQIGLRIDVDTLRGTRYGVPRLCRLLAEEGIYASFFFSVGPDNMGRHLWRLIRPSFLRKMLRTKASRLYGWDILLKGTFWPGPLIGKKAGDCIRSAAETGHEIGLHAWDHHAWQAHIERLNEASIFRHIKKGVDALTEITGCRPRCSAVPGWRCTDTVLRQKGKFTFSYNSDCRGTSIFFPVVDGALIPQPQIPVTLPTYDEIIGRSSVSADNYNTYLLSLLKPGILKVLTIHAEVEGIICHDDFRCFIQKARSKGYSFCPLGALLTSSSYSASEKAAIRSQEIEGREGWVSCQAPLFK